MCRTTNVRDDSFDSCHLPRPQRVVRCEVYKKSFSYYRNPIIVVDFKYLGPLHEVEILPPEHSVRTTESPSLYINS